MQRSERASVLRHTSISCLALELPVGAYLEYGYGIESHRRHSGLQLPSYDVYCTGIPYNGQPNTAVCELQLWEVYFTLFTGHEGP
jgi:hypothetical protein